MARWVPKLDGKIEPSEPLGRRLFDHPALVGATDQRTVLQSLDYRNFEERRDGGEVSLDRLGRSSVEPKVLGYLAARGEADGANRRPPKTFDGWASIQAKRLSENKSLRLEVIASPVGGAGPLADVDSDLTENVYHSHVRPLDDRDPYSVALHLKTLFERHGKIEPSPRAPNRSGRLRTLLLEFSAFVRRCADRFR
jgi:hypothetical protein